MRSGVKYLVNMKLLGQWTMARYWLRFYSENVVVWFNTKAVVMLSGFTGTILKGG